MNGTEAGYHAGIQGVGEVVESSILVSQAAERRDIGHDMALLLKTACPTPVLYSL